MLISHLETEGAELIVLTGYMRILSPSFVRHYKDRILNIHPALLPSFRGMDAFSRPWPTGKMDGTTVHIVDEDVDHGPIVYQPVPVLEDDTHDSLKARIQRAEYKAYPRAIKMFIEGRPRVREESSSGKERRDNMEKFMGSLENRLHLSTKPKGCIFCDKPAEKKDEENYILYSRYHFIILNAFPYNNGHMMVVPYQHGISLYLGSRRAAGDDAAC